MKKIVLINSDIEDFIRKYFQNKNVEIVENESNADLIIYDDFDGELTENAINIHPSLLPAFDCENAIEKAFTSGVKVSGITVYDNNRIIAQYPVLIGVDTHIDEFIKDMQDVKKRLLPAVIEALLEDRVFDFQDLFRNPCAHKNGGCSGCGGCN